MDSKNLALSLWPNPSFFSVPVANMIVVPEQLPTDASKLRRELIEYLLAIGEHLEFKLGTLALALDIACRYLQQKQQESKQLILLTALFIAAKIHEIEAFSLDIAHKFSDHSYTSREILKCESNILKATGFRILNEKNQLNSYTELLLNVVLPLVPVVREDTHALFFKTIHDIEKLLFRHPPLASCKILGPSIILAALVILSQSHGRFPMICRLSKLSGASEQEINSTCLKVLKSVLGKDFYKSLNL